MRRLLRLTIDDFGLIAHAGFAFADGLTVFSGETGSGKTMLLGALAFALGERTEGDVVRTGAARARVALEIEPDDALRTTLEAAGFALAADDDCVIVRELAPSGRSQARINGIAASASQLREVGRAIVDIVGQHEAQRLLTPAFALDLVDRFGGLELARMRDEVRALYREAADVRAELAVLRGDDGRALAQLEFARFALGEIDAAALEDDEDLRLRERRDVLANAEKITTALAQASAALEAESGAIDALGAAASALGTIARYSENFGALAAALGVLQSEANDLAGKIAREIEAIEADPVELDVLETRLATIERLKKKYGGSIVAIRATRAEFAALLERDAGRDARIAALEVSSTALERTLSERAASLGEARRRAAGEFEGLVAAELTVLAMPAARFSVALETLESIGPGGAERAELRLAPNPGEPERALAKSASGGELSRVLLALIVALADRRERTALVFDEIDAGIGGATALVVGARLARLACAGQVVVVTHLAQIAAWAQAHYVLRKHDAGVTTRIDLVELDAHEQRQAEIARMLAGNTSAVALEHAAALLAGAREGVA